MVCCQKSMTGTLSYLTTCLRANQTSKKYATKFFKSTSNIDVSVKSNYHADMLKRDIQPYIPDLKARLITNREVARLLNVTEAHLSRTLKDLGIQKDPAKNARLHQKQLTKTRKEHRASAANRLPPEEAAKAANCSIRTIYRYKNGKL